MAITTLLTLIFLVLKLCGVIAWSWWWVFTPMMVGALIWIIVVALVARHL